MPRVMTTRTVHSPDVAVFRAKFTDTMKAATGDVALDTADKRFHILTVPPECVVTGGRVEILTASDAAGPLAFTIGTATDPDAVITLVNAKTAGSSLIDGVMLDALTHDPTPIYMTTSGSTAPGTLGEFIITIEYVQVTSACRVVTYGMDGSKYDVL